MVIGDDVSLNRYAKRRDDNEPEIIKALEAIGCDVEQLDRPVDLVVKLASRIRFIEVKNPDGFNREEKGQVEFLEKWPGGFARSAEEAIRIMTDG